MPKTNKEKKQHQKKMDAKSPLQKVEHKKRRSNENNDDDGPNKEKKQHQKKMDAKSPLQKVEHKKRVTHVKEVAKGENKELAVKRAEDANDPEAKKAAKKKLKHYESKQKQKKINSLISSSLLFFFIPILVSSIKIMEIMNNIIMTKKNTNSEIGRYDGFLFLFIIFISIYSIVKSVLGSTEAFIYMVFASMAICYKAYKMYME